MDGHQGECRESRKRKPEDQNTPIPAAGMPPSKKTVITTLQVGKAPPWVPKTRSATVRELGLDAYNENMDPGDLSNTEGEGPSFSQVEGKLDVYDTHPAGQAYSAMKADPKHYKAVRLVLYCIRTFFDEQRNPSYPRPGFFAMPGETFEGALMRQKAHQEAANEGLKVLASTLGIEWKTDKINFYNDEFLAYLSNTPRDEDNQNLKANDFVCDAPTLQVVESIVKAMPSTKFFEAHKKYRELASYLNRDELRETIQHEETRVTRLQMTVSCRLSLWELLLPWNKHLPNIAVGVNAVWYDTAHKLNMAGTFMEHMKALYWALNHAIYEIRHLPENQRSDIDRQTLDGHDERSRELNPAQSEARQKIKQAWTNNRHSGMLQFSRKKK
ncbi:hypothetical protein FPQ18DRAFT_394524 [Pyronema domesticum]|nr:hypothetical protein FPQ18DRAFT_394524 [Pyronema domesticum]